MGRGNMSAAQQRVCKVPTVRDTMEHDSIQHGKSCLTSSLAVNRCNMIWTSDVSLLPARLGDSTVIIRRVQDQFRKCKTRIPRKGHFRKDQLEREVRVFFLSPWLHRHDLRDVVLLQMAMARVVVSLSGAVAENDTTLELSMVPLRSRQLPTAKRWEPLKLQLVTSQNVAVASYVVYSSCMFMLLRTYNN